MPDRRTIFGAGLRRIAIFRALQLGDWLVAIPALRALRAALPHAHVTLIGLPWAHVLIERYSQYLNDFLAFPGYPGLPERPFEAAAFPAFVQAAQSAHFDLIIQMHGSGAITNPLVGLLGGKETAGYYRPGDYCPNSATFLPYPQELPELWKHLRLMEFLGAPPQGEELEFPVRPEDDAGLRAIDASADLPPGSYVCIHPGARAEARRWPIDHFATVADALARSGLRIVLTGSRDEVALTAKLRDAMHAPALDLAGRTDLGPLAALLRDARLLICNDTGVSHLADALRVPSVVVLHRLSDREAWPPRDRQLHRAVSGVQGVTTDLVLEQARGLLDSPYAHRRNSALKETPCVRCAS